MSRLLPLLLLATACATTTGSTGGPSSAAARRPFDVKVVGHGPPMVLIPGLASSGEVWNEVVAHYQDRYECHVLTLAGFAGQPAISGPLLPAVHDALIQYLTENKLDHPVVVGHSLGGFMGLWLATSNPDLVGQLVIIDSAPSLAALQAPSITDTEAKQQADELRSQLRMATPDQRAKFSRMAAKGMVTDAAQVDRVAGWSMKSDSDTVADAMYYVMTHDLRPELGSVRAPTLVIGTWVSYRPYATRADLLERFTAQYSRCGTCKVTLTDKARHFVMLDDPTGLLAQVDGFLQTSAPEPLSAKAP